MHVAARILFSLPFLISVAQAQQTGAKIIYPGAAATASAAEASAASTSDFYTTLRNASARPAPLAAGADMTSALQPSALPEKPAMRQAKRQYLIKVE